MRQHTGQMALRHTGDQTEKRLLGIEASVQGRRACLPSEHEEDHGCTGASSVLAHALRPRFPATTSCRRQRGSGTQMQALGVPLGSVGAFMIWPMSVSMVGKLAITAWESRMVAGGMHRLKLRKPRRRSLRWRSSSASRSLPSRPRRSSPPSPTAGSASPWAVGSLPCSRSFLAPVYPY